MMFSDIDIGYRTPPRVVSTCDLNKSPSGINDIISDNRRIYENIVPCSLFDDVLVESDNDVLIESDNDIKFLNSIISRTVPSIDMEQDDDFVEKKMNDMFSIPLNTQCRHITIDKKGNHDNILGITNEFEDNEKIPINVFEFDKKRTLDEKINNLNQVMNKSLKEYESKISSFINENQRYPETLFCFEGSSLKLKVFQKIPSNDCNCSSCLSITSNELTKKMETFQKYIEEQKTKTNVHTSGIKRKLDCILKTPSYCERFVLCKIFTIHSGLTLEQLIVVLMNAGFIKNVIPKFSFKNYVKKQIHPLEHLLFPNDNLENMQITNFNHIEVNFC